MTYGSLGRGHFPLLFLLLGYVSSSWVEEPVNCFRAYAEAGPVCKPPYSNQERKDREQRPLRGGPWRVCCVRAECSMTEGVVKLDCASRTWMVVGIVIYDVPTPKHVRIIWQARPLRLMKGSQSSSICAWGTLCGDDFWIYCCWDGSKNVDVVWTHVCSRIGPS